MLNGKRRTVRDDEFREASKREIKTVETKRKRKRKTKKADGKGEARGRKLRIDLKQGNKVLDRKDKGKGAVVSNEAKPEQCSKVDKGKGVAVDSTEEEVSTQSQDLLMLDIVMPDTGGQAGPSRTAESNLGNKRKAEDLGLEEAPAKRAKVSSSLPDPPSAPEEVNKSMPHEDEIFESLSEWSIEDLEQRFIDCRAVHGLIREWSCLSSRLDILNGQRAPSGTPDTSSYRGFMSRYSMVFLIISLLNSPPGRMLDDSAFTSFHSVILTVIYKMREERNADVRACVSNSQVYN